MQAIPYILRKIDAVIVEDPDLSLHVMLCGDPGIGERLVAGVLELFLAAFVAIERGIAAIATGVAP